MIKGGRHFNTERIKHFVIDEYEEMVTTIGMKNLINCIFNSIPNDIEAVMISTASLLETGKAKIVVDNKHRLSLENFGHFYVNVNDEEYKLNMLSSFKDTMMKIPTVIFCNTKQKVITLKGAMDEHGLKSVSLYGKLSDLAKKSALKQFHDGSIDLLISTNAFSHAIEKQQSSMIIMYDFPLTFESYIQRYFILKVQTLL